MASGDVEQGLRLLVHLAWLATHNQVRGRERTERSPEREAVAGVISAELPESWPTSVLYLEMASLPPPLTELNAYSALT